VPFVERDEDVRIAGADGAVVGIREADAGVRDADVVENAGDFLRGNQLANRHLDMVDQLRGLLDSRAAAGAHVEAKGPAVALWEEVLAEPRDEEKG
jgi:hypothetical protein